MSRHWEAPQTAYELAADWVERARELAADSGGFRGQFIPSPGIGKNWYDLRIAERHDVLEALSMQARSAAFEYKKRAGLRTDEPLIMRDAEFSHRMCEQAAEALVMMCDPGGGEWTMPECSHCTALIAEALISIEVASFLSIGIADPAIVLRMMADNVRVPAHRKPADNAVLEAEMQINAGCTQP